MDKSLSKHCVRLILEDFRVDLTWRVSSNFSMKIFSILIGVIFLSTFSFAMEEEVPFDYDPEFAKSIQNYQPQIIPPLTNIKNYLWLYDLIIPDEHKTQKDESLKSFSVHLEDSYKHFPHPDFIIQSSLKPPGLQKGSMTYVGFWPMSYNYDVLLAENGTRVIRVKIHFKNPKGNDLENFGRKIKEAQALWNDSRPEMDFPYEFLFEIEKDQKKAHYSLNIKDKTRGPYSVNWSRGWSSESIAHELGHMMGLSDEYETLSGKMYCLKISLMCGSKNSKLMPHHYYFILRRLIK